MARTDRCAFPFTAAAEQGACLGAAAGACREAIARRDSAVPRKTGAGARRTARVKTTWHHSANIRARRQRTDGGAPHRAPPRRQRSAQRFAHQTATRANGSCCISARIAALSKRASPERRGEQTKRRPLLLCVAQPYRALSWACGVTTANVGGARQRRARKGRALSLFVLRQHGAQTARLRPLP